MLMKYVYNFFTQEILKANEGKTTQNNLALKKGDKKEGKKGGCKIKIIRLFIKKGIVNIY